MIASHASYRRFLHLLPVAADHMRHVGGVRSEGRSTWLVIALAHLVVHRLHVPVRLWSVAFGRILYLRESFFLSLRRRFCYRPICTRNQCTLSPVHVLLTVGLRIRDVVQLALDVLQCKCTEYIVESRLRYLRYFWLFLYLYHVVCFYSYTVGWSFYRCTEYSQSCSLPT